MDGFVLEPVEWGTFAPRVSKGQETWSAAHAALAASVQRRLEEVLLELGDWLYERTGSGRLALAGGVALNWPSSPARPPSAPRNRASSAVRRLAEPS